MNIWKPLERLTEKKAVSPVISTIIIVAIATALSIALVPYLTGISSSFTQSGRLDVTYAYADTYNNTHYLAYFMVKNSGARLNTIDRVLIDGKPQDFAANWTVNNHSSGTTASGVIILDGSDDSWRVITIAPGDMGRIILYLSRSNYKSGQFLEIAFQTVGGYEWPKVVVIPTLP